MTVASQPQPAVHLTRPQKHELGRLVRGAQPTFGSGRARVQRLLVAKGCAEFTTEAGDVVQGPDFADRCRATPLGVALHRGSKS